MSRERLSSRVRAVSGALQSPHRVAQSTTSGDRKAVLFWPWVVVGGIGFLIVLLVGGVSLLLRPAVWPAPLADSPAPEAIQPTASAVVRRTWASRSHTLESRPAQPVPPSTISESSPISAPQLPPAAGPSPEALQPAAPARACETHGTTIQFTSNPAAAARQALKEDKLLLVLHVSGNFEDPGFT